MPAADDRGRPSGRQALAIATTGMAAAIFVSIAIGIGWRHNTHEWWTLVIAESIGLPFMIAGLVGWWKRPSNGLASTVQLVLTLSYGLGLVTLPFAFLSGLLRVRLAFQEVAGLVVELQRDSSPVHLRGLLGDTLGGPDLTLGFWSAGSREYVDAQGQRIIPPTSDDARAATFVESAGQPMAMLVHDPALAEQQVVVKAVVAVAQSAPENARLQAAQIAEIKASRARIAEDALDDRRKIERDLHDGVQGRLLWLMHLAEQLRAAAGDNPERPELAQRLNELVAEIRTTHAVLRDLTQGIHPAILNTKGLAAAVEELALRIPVPVRVGLPTNRWLPAVQATAFFVISEALSNVVKHAHAEQVMIRGWEQGDRLVVELPTTASAEPILKATDYVVCATGSTPSEGNSTSIVRIILELPCT